VLAEHFLQRFGGRAGIEFAAEVPGLLAAYHWPGNVRQLRNAIERGCALAQDGTLRPQDLPAEVLGGEAAPAASDTEQATTFQAMKARTIAAMERSYLEGLLKKHKGNVTHSADEAGMTRSALQKLLQKHGLKGSDYR